MASSFLGGPATTTSHPVRGRCAIRGICRVTHSPLILLPPRTLQSRLGHTRAPGLPMAHTQLHWTPGSLRVTSGHARRGPPRPATRAAGSAEAEEETVKLADPPDLIQTARASKTICSGGRAAQGTGANTAGAGRSCAGPQGLHGKEAWLAFPLQQPELLGSGGAGLQGSLGEL